MANPLQQAMQRQFIDDALASKLQPLKPALSHVGLYMGLVFYTALGALVIHSLINAITFDLGKPAYLWVFFKPIKEDNLVMGLVFYGNFYGVEKKHVYDQKNINPKLKKITSRLNVPICFA